MELPADLGRDWDWHADLNIVVLRKGLDCQAKLAALDDLQRHWTRAHLSVVQSA